MRSYLIDLDGTVYNGGRLIAHAKEFIDHLNSAGVRYAFATNCPLRNPDKIVEKLRGLGLDVASDCVISSGQAAVEYILQKYGNKSVFLIGSEDLRDLCGSHGIKMVKRDADVVLVGFDPKFDYGKLETAVRCINNGAEYIVTNGDNTIPGDDGVIPHTGAIAASITASTGKTALCIGKPAGFFLDIAMRKFQCSRDDIAVIGDRIDTDILFALNNGVKSYLVLSGITQKSDIASLSLDESITVVENLRQIIDLDGGEYTDVRQPL